MDADKLVGEIIYFLIQDGVSHCRRYLGRIAHVHESEHGGGRKFEMNLALPPAGTTLKFPFDQETIPKDLIPTVEPLMENGNFATFCVQEKMCGHVYLLPRDLKADLVSWNNRIFTGYGPEDLEVHRKKICLFKEYDYDMFGTSVYVSIWKVVYKIVEIQADYRALPEASLELISCEQLGGSVFSESFRIERNGTPLHIGPGQKFTYSSFLNNFDKSEIVLPLSSYKLKESDSPSKIYRHLLKHVVKSWGLTRRVVARVNVPKEKHQSSEYFFTEDNKYGRLFGESLTISTFLDLDFLQTSDSFTGGQMLKKGDVIYSYLVPSRQKGKQELRWMLSSPDGYHCHGFQSSNAVSDLDIFVRFVSSDGEDSMFAGKKPSDIVKMCKLQGKTSTPFSDLLEGWFNPSVDNKTVNFFRDFYIALY